MRGDIQKIVEAVPFVPFTIHLAGGGQLRVPSVDHIAAPPAGSRNFVFKDKDDGGYEVLSGPLISRIAVDRETPAARTVSRAGAPPHDEKGGPWPGPPCALPGAGGPPAYSPWAMMCFSRSPTRLE